MRVMQWLGKEAPKRINKDNVQCSHRAWDMPVLMVRLENAGHKGHCMRISAGLFLSSKNN
jgi:hypothetical protein